MTQTADSILADLDQAPQAPTGARPPKMRYTHEAMVDLMIQNPGIAQKDLARVFGYTEAWISTIVTSDAFRALLAQRREQFVDPEIRLTVRERHEALARRALQVLQEKLSKPADAVDDNLALRAAELSTKALGLGQQVNVAITSEERLKSLAHRLLALNGGSTPQADIIDVEATKAA